MSYGTDSLQRMDIYLPAGRSATYTKSIVLIHGGGWNSGSKSDFASYIDSFKRRLPDYAIFNIDYRLVTNTNLFPAQENDVKAALDFITANASQYQINKEKIALLGASAGAHLALLQAYKYPQLPVKAVIDFFGPTDLTAMYRKPWHPMIPYLLQMLTGTTPEAKPEVYEASSPAHFVTPQSPPTLILQGGGDQVVHPSQSYLLKKKLEQANVVHDMVVYPGERHGWRGKALTNSFDRIESFLKENLN
jgi:acetyl esterase/lipase